MLSISPLFAFKGYWPVVLPLGIGWYQGKYSKGRKIPHKHFPVLSLHPFLYLPCYKGFSSWSLKWCCLGISGMKVYLNKLNGRVFLMKTDQIHYEQKCIVKITSTKYSTVLSMRTHQCCCNIIQRYRWIPLLYLSKTVINYPQKEKRQQLLTSKYASSVLHSNHFQVYFKVP